MISKIFLTSLLALFISTPLVAQTFTDVTRQAGITFRHNNGAFGKKFLPETMGAGCAFLDYDNDGWLDILFVNGMDFPGHKRKKTTLVLYRNTGKGSFTDATAAARLNVEMYGMGVAAADYDNDGDCDVYVSALGADRLFRNDRGVFTDVTQQSGISNPDYGASAAFLDYNRDGRLDLFVTNYVEWSEKGDIFCSLEGTAKSYCTPESYKGVSSRLFQNLGGGRFKEVTREAGLYDPKSKALGLVTFDYDGDGFVDLLVANDTQPNKLYHNNRNGTFTEVGMQAGIAFSEDGMVRGAMGIDAGDYDRTGRLSVVIGNFSNEMVSLYHNEGKGFFIDEAPSSTIGQASLLTLKFGAFFFDYDLDGWLDIFIANGHVENDINRVQKRVTFAQPPHLFRNLGQKRFEETTQKAGLGRALVGRGSAYGDYDNDGDLDILVTTNGGPPVLYRNDQASKNNWLTLRLRGMRNNRDGIGAVVKVTSGGVTQQNFVRSGSSYCSQSDLALTFGLGKNGAAERIEILWPNGTRQEVKNVAANRRIVIEEGKGLN
ncbi:MAG: CRTAC1 family protein [Acidobacteriota bacterium]